MIRQILAKQSENTNYFFDSLDLIESEKIVQLLLNCKGMIYLTGVGKSGLVAKKIAFTMVSTGTKAIYISPTDAVHGDLGMVSNQDVFIILSKSGESDELVALVPAIRNKGALVIAIVCNPNSRLSACCHHSFTLPMKSELCPFDLAPTTSATAQLLFGDLLTIALMQHKNFSLEQYAANHPSGRIGKRITLKVKDLMLTGLRIPLCHPSDKLKEILFELSNKRCGCILVVDEKKHLKGIFTDGDLRRSLQKHGGSIVEAPMNELMSKSAKWIGPNVLAYDALKFMEGENQRVMMLPVLDAAEGQVMGLLHLHDIIQSGI